MFAYSFIVLSALNSSTEYSPRLRKSISQKQVEIYLCDGKDDGTTYSYLYKAVTEENKEELQIVMFPNFKIEFDELFKF